MAAIYRHTQVGYVTLGALGVAALGAAWSSIRTSSPIALGAALLLGGLVMMFSTLTVVVDDASLDVSFGPGLIRRRIPLGRIRAAREVRNRWYYGWGMRLTPAGWLWNVSGLGAVEVEFDDGHRFRIGSDEPGRLAEALQWRIRG
ncbi:MAG: hypothetical protein AB7G23_18520 [Vicinamibacterales bacterium]